MMKKFMEPEMNISKFDVADIIASSDEITGIMDPNDLLGWAAAEKSE